MLIVSVLMYFLYNNITALWVLFVSLGAVSGPLAGSGFGMVNRYVEMNAAAQCVPQIGAAVGDLIIMSAVGYSYENFGPYSIWGHLVGICSVVFCVAIFMQILGNLHGDRYATDK